MTEIFAAIIGAVVGAALSGFFAYKISYPIGVEQGKQQVRHERSVAVLTDIYQRLLRLRNEIRSLTEVLPERESEQQDKVFRQFKELQNYHEENGFVLDRGIHQQVERIIEQLDRHLSTFAMNLSLSSLGEDEKEERDRRYKAGVEMALWLERGFSTQLSSLEEQVKKVIGTDEILPRRS